MAMAAVAFLAPLSSILASDAQSAFATAGTRTRARLVPFAPTAAFREWPSTMGGPGERSTALRLRPRPGPSARSSLHRDNGTHDASKRRRPPTSKFFQWANYYPWRRRQSWARVGTSLREAPLAEDTLDCDSEEKLTEAAAESFVHRMESGSGPANVTYAVTANGATTEPPASIAGAAVTANGATTEPPASIAGAGTPVAAILVLNLVAVVWGTQHAVIKSVVDDRAAEAGGGLLRWIETAGLKPGDFTSGGVAGDAGWGEDAAAYFTLARFGLAALLAAPFTPGLSGVAKNLGWGKSAVPVNGVIDVDGETHRQTNTQRVDDDSVALAWKYGVELGVYMFLGFAFQAIGLETTTASRSGFLLYLNVKFVPFLAYFLFGRHISPRAWISAVVAFLGTALLAFDSASAAVGAENGGKDLAMAFNVGDLWSIAAAVASALFILRVEAASKAVPRSAELNAANLWTVAVLSLLWTLSNALNGAGGAESITAIVPAMQQTFRRTISMITSHPLPLIYLSGVTTALANFLQSKAQKDVSAERAAVIYAMDPVYGAIFANVLLGETLGGLGLLGASFILVAAATNAVLDFGDEGPGGSQEKEV